MTTINKKQLGLYIHIPFCLSRCRYCGFYSNAIGKHPTQAVIQEEAAYVDGLIQELNTFEEKHGTRYNLDTVFIGGGTPSILPPAQLARLMQAIDRHFPITEDMEITMEANPGTLTPESLSAYREMGINRLSIGLQSFSDDILSAMGRAHTVKTFLQSWDYARDAGFQNMNIDLMFDFPGQRLTQWEDTVDRALQLHPEHLSFYGLQIEEGTPLYEDYRMERIPEINEKDDAAMYKLAASMIRSEGFHHYEISNAALPGKECRHNLKYWHFQDYLGIGDSAGSFIDEVRKTNPPFEECHVNTFLESCGEYTFTALRTDEGVDLEDFRSRFGRPFWVVFADRRKEFQDCVNRGWVKEEAGHLVLTLDGIPVSNDVMSIFV